MTLCKCFERAHVRHAQRVMRLISNCALVLNTAVNKFFIRLPKAGRH